MEAQKREKNKTHLPNTLRESKRLKTYKPKSKSEIQNQNP
jgi:hypothetical protein